MGSGEVTGQSLAFGLPAWHRERHGLHFAQFFEDDETLVASAREYVEAAIADGAYAIVVATHEHIDALLELWRAAGVDTVSWLKQEQLLLLDAEQTLAAFMEDDTPRLDRFMTVVGPAVAQGAKRSQRVAVFGEMVSLLLKRGLADAAIRVERFWNMLAGEYTFSLFCGFNAPANVDAARMKTFARICQLHDHVVAPARMTRQEEADAARTSLREHSRELEEQLARQQEAEEGLSQLAAIVANSDDAIVSKTLQGVVRSWNAGAERIFGYRAGEIIGKPITTIIPPELRHEEDVILARIRRGERIAHFETIRVTKNGRRIPVSITVSPVRNARGEIIGASKIARDVSERHLADEAIRASERALTAEVNALARLNERSSRLWRCRDINAGLNEMLAAVIDMLGADSGYVRLIERGNGGSRLMTAAHHGLAAAPEFLDDVAKADALPCLIALTQSEQLVVADIDTDADAKNDMEALRACMDHFASRAVVAIPLIAPDNVEQGALCVFFRRPHRPDQQDLRRLDLYARQASDFIQRSEIEMALRRNEEALRENDRRKDEFLAMLAHELRNPLAPIRFAAAANRRASGGSAHQRADAIIERQVQHMSRLLDDLLDVSRVTRGRIKLHRGIVDFSDIVSTAVETARPALDAKQHQLTITLPTEPLQVDGDSVRLAQVLSNLLLNAAKYTPQRGRISLDVETAENALLVRVKDNGVGIAADMMPRLFTLFVQVHSHARNVDGGLGIGLALVRALVALHGGTVEASSEGLGKGSEFRVRLPILVPSRQLPADPAYSNV